MAVTMKKAVFWDAFLRSVLRLLVTATVVPSSPILVNLMMKMTRSSETPVFTRAPRRNIPEDGVINFNDDPVLLGNKNKNKLRGP
jgi:hypothetical protein